MEATSCQTNSLTMGEIQQKGWHHKEGKIQTPAYGWGFLFDAPKLGLISALWVRKYHRQLALIQNSVLGFDPKLADERYQNELLPARCLQD